MPKEVRQKSLAEAGVTVEIDTTQAIAIKADLAIPWFHPEKVCMCISMTNLHVHVHFTCQKMLAKTCQYSSDG